MFQRLVLLNVYVLCTINFDPDIDVNKPYKPKSTDTNLISFVCIFCCWFYSIPHQEMMNMFELLYIHYSL